MKRTQERHGFAHDSKFGISSVRVLDGEDRAFEERKRAQAQAQKDWIEQQKREKKMQQEMEREELRAYAAQDDTVHKLRGMMEDDQNTKRRQMAEAMRDANRQLAQEKRDREKADKEREAAIDRADLEMREATEFMREKDFRATVEALRRL